MRRLSLAVLLALVVVASVVVLVKAQRPHEQQQAATLARKPVEPAATPETPHDHTAPDHTAPALPRTQDKPLPRPGKAKARKGEVSFEDGTRIPINMQPVDLTSPPFAVPERLVDRYAELVRLAREGHSGAARSLFKWLKICQRAPPDQASLDRAVEQLHATREVKWSDPSRPVMKLRPGADLKQFEKLELQQPYEFCQGIAAEQKAEAEQWQKVAVEMGDLQTVEEYAAGLGDTPEALQVWETLWNEKGLRGSLQPLAIIYSRGVGGSGPDHVRAYAYMLIEQKLLELIERESVGQSQRAMLAGVDNSLRYVGGFLDPQQTQAATALAQRLIAENPNCCSGSIFGMNWQGNLRPSVK
ncbi:MAG: hypothetical protein ACREXP_11130 [Steroidobacteraceae bacterium]